MYADFRKVEADASEIFHVLNELKVALGSLDRWTAAIKIGDCAIQFMHHDLPFGGVNDSGMGTSHGHFGFQAFSNEKPIWKQKRGPTAVKAFYPPFTSRTKKLMDWFLRLF